MCFFITIAVPGERAALLTHAVDRSFAIRPQRNESIARHVGDRAAFVVTMGGCSCDLYAREGADRAAVASKELEAARKKCAKRGWSAAKIERALAALHTSADRGRPFVGLRQDARDFIASIAEAAGEVALLVHDYSGQIDEETVVARQDGVSTPDDLRTGTASLEEDVILWIRAAR